MRFVETDKGSVNLDHVLSIRSHGLTTKQGRETVHVLIGPNGDQVGEVKDHSFSVYALDSVDTVPASPGEFGWVVTHSQDGDRRPATVDDLDIEMSKVIAWRIPRGHEPQPEPVFVEPPASNQTVLLPLLEGRVCRPMSCEYDSLDSAKTDLLQEFQSSGDTRHQATEAAAMPA
jgi:hypothetical protein